MQKNILNNPMTVMQMKSIIAVWPDVDEHGEPCEVWIGNANGTTNEVWEVWPLNKRESEDGRYVWADLLLLPNTEAELSR